MKLALFDLDKTLLPIDSDQSWGEFTTRLGWTDGESFKRRNDAFYEQYKARTLDINEYIAFATEAFVARGRTAAEAAHATFMRDTIRPAIQQPAVDLLQHYADTGYTNIIVTATNEFVTRPIAAALGVQYLIAVNLQRDTNDWYTSAIAGVPSAREGKLTRVTQWLAERHSTWGDVEHSVFFTDSLNDLALLEHVDEAVATNPEPALRTLALERQWRILDLFA